MCLYPGMDKVCTGPRFASLGELSGSAGSGRFRVLIMTALALSSPVAD
jgi:hypothetical protein